MKLVARIEECEVWLVDLRASESRYESALALLSDAERARARAIRRETARRRFVLARAALRVRLAYALGIAPARVALRIGEHGKPELAPAPREERLSLREHGIPGLFALPTEGWPPLREHGKLDLVSAPREGWPRLREHGTPEPVPPHRDGGPRLREHGTPESVPPHREGWPRLREHGTPEIAHTLPGAEVGAAHVSQGPPRFNLAHRDGAALLAINHRRYDVGVDLERIASGSRPWERLLARICHPAEAREALAEARTIGSRAFYERWVGKEAVLKALGLGLRVSPAEVPLRRDGAGVLQVVEPPGRRSPASGMPGAVAAGCRAAGVDGDLASVNGDLAGWGWAPARALAGCRLATVRTPAGFVGAVALLAPREPSARPITRSPRAESALRP
jgi:phosphopantetheinyl transferase